MIALHINRAIGHLALSAAIKKARFRSRAAGLRNPPVVFVWIPKNAGTSIWRAMHERHCPKLKNLTAIERCFVPAGLVTFGHMSYAELLAKGYVPRDFDARAFKFAVGRNPFDRLVSLYRYLRKISVLDEDTGFDRFVERIHGEPIPPVGLYSTSGLSQCNPQLDWIVDERGDFLVDAVLRYEALVEDWNQLLGRLRMKISLRHENRSGAHVDYRRWYNTRTAAMVADRYAADFERLGYSKEVDD